MSPLKKRAVQFCAGMCKIWTSLLCWMESYVPAIQCYCLCHRLLTPVIALVQREAFQLLFFLFCFLA